jgi:hypothetical protein
MLCLLLLACGLSEPDTLPASPVPVAITPANPAPIEVPPPEAPVWRAEVVELTPQARKEMRGVSWHEGCPISLDALREVHMTHHTFEGGVAMGVLVVAESVSGPVIDAFEAAFETGYPIKLMRPVRSFGGDDGQSMEADNTSAFNCRPVTGGSGWSQHSYGTAIDVNPVENPYVSRSGVVSPEAGRAYLDRARTDEPAMLSSESPLVKTLVEQGWGWGGQWRSVKDYQHLSQSGR